MLLPLVSTPDSPRRPQPSAPCRGRATGAERCPGRPFSLRLTRSRAFALHSAGEALVTGPRCSGRVSGPAPLGSDVTGRRSLLELPLPGSLAAALHFPSSVSVSPLNGERPRTRRSSVLLCPQTYNSSPDLPLTFRPLCLLGGRRGVSHRTGLKRLDLSRAKTLTPRASPSQGVAGPTCPKAFAPSLPPFSVSPLV